MTFFEFEMPKSWTVATLKEVTLPVRQVSPKKIFSTDFDYIEVSGLNRDKHVVDKTTRHEANRAPSRAKQLVSCGDVLFSNVRVYLENIAAVPERLDGAIASSAFTVLRPAEGIKWKYLFHYVTLRKFIQNLIPLQHGNSPPAVLEEDVRSQRIPLPPSKEQSRIVSKIEELFSDLDKGEESLRQAQAQLKRYRQSVLKAAVTGELTRDWREQNKDRLETGEALLKRILKARREAWEKAELKKMRAKGVKPKDDSWKKKYVEPKEPDTSGLPELPEGWAWASMGQLFNVYIGSTPSRKASSYWNGNIPWVSSGEVAFCRINKTQEFITQEGYDNSSVKIHPVGTVLLAMIGEGKTRGQAAILDIEACHNQNCASIRVSETPIPPEYIYQLLSIRYEDNRQKGQGGNQPALNKELVQAITVPLPPLEEINEVLRTMEEVLLLVGVLYKDIKKGVALNSSLKQSILKSAFSGTLVPQDPNDEPASELLKRIAAEKDTPLSPSPVRRTGPRQKKREAPAPAKQTDLPKAMPQKKTASGLAQLRKAAGMSQAELAKAIGLNQAYVSQMETGKRVISKEIAEAMSRALDVDPTSFAV